MPNPHIEEAERRMQAARSYYNGASSGNTGSLKRCVFALMEVVHALLIYLKTRD